MLPSGKNTYRNFLDRTDSSVSLCSWLLPLLTASSVKDVSLKQSALCTYVGSQREWNFWPLWTVWNLKISEKFWNQNTYRKPHILSYFSIVVVLQMCRLRTKCFKNRDLLANELIRTEVWRSVLYFQSRWFSTRHKFPIGGSVSRSVVPFTFASAPIYPGEPDRSRH